jgi:hypothetical protein
MRRGLIVLGVLVFLWTLVLHAPAAVIYGWIAGPTTPVRWYGLEGTVSEGKAAGVQASGTIVAKQLQWSMDLWQLLLARAAFHVQSFGRDALMIDGKVAINPLRTVHLSDMRISGTLRPLLAATGKPYLPLDAQASLHIERLTMRGGVPTDARGVLQMQGLRWTLGRQPVPIGDFQASVAPADDSLVATITTIAGSLDASGSARLNSDQSYVIDLALRPGPGADPAIINLLQQTGSPDAQGAYRLRQTGQLTNANDLDPAPQQ